MVQIPFLSARRRRVLLSGEWHLESGQPPLETPCRSRVIALRMNEAHNPISALKVREMLARALQTIGTHAID
jgi:hypothetical protein